VEGGWEDGKKERKEKSRGASKENRANNEGCKEKGQTQGEVEAKTE